MISKCSIKQKVLPYRGEPTRSYHNPNLQKDLVSTRKPSPVKTFADEDMQGRVKEIVAKRQRVANERHDIVAMLARDGLPYEEIAEKTGYKLSSVRRLVRKLRADGEDIPLRQRGRKKNADISGNHIRVVVDPVRMHDRDDRRRRRANLFGQLPCPDRDGNDFVEQ